MKTTHLLPLALAAVLWAPGAHAAQTIDNQTVTAEQLSEDISVKNGGTLVLTGDNPLGSYKVDLADHSCSLIFEGLLVSEAKPLLGNITIAGKAFDEKTDRLSIYGNGSEIIPDGWSTPLTIYKGENFTGESMVCERDIYYRGKKVAPKKNYLTQIEIGDFDNSIRSFKLRKGFSVVFANNSDGTGYSRCYVATDTDIEVAAMPEGLEFASFIRVCRADRVGKRGICGLDITPVTRSTWYYSWGASDESQENFEFVPMRHNMWWDGFDKINSRVDNFNLLGYNEPDHSDQSDLSPDYAIDNWPEFMKSGLRAGSPAPDAISKDWLKTFIRKADSLNYRVDFVATHMYWNSQTPDGLTDNINKLCQNTYGGRPMWITEWNNGANWTHEWWPDASGTKLDANFEPILDEKGNTSTVNRPHTEANSAVQCEWLGKMLKAFDECKWLERHSFYNWVEDARSVVIDGKLTPAGKIFADFHSEPGFDHKREYVHEWRIAPPRVHKVQYNSYFTIEFYDQNGETGKNYIVERRFNRGSWEQIAVLENGKDYKKAGQNNTFRDYDFPESGLYQYRFKATSYKDTESGWSTIISARVEVDDSGVDAPTAADAVVYGKSGVLYIETPVPAAYTVYRPDGRLVRTINAEEGINTVYDLPHGMYIVNRTKVVL